MIFSIICCLVEDRSCGKNGISCSIILSIASNLSLIHSNYKENGTSLDRKTELNDSVSIVHQLIAKLPENQRIIIQLRDVEEYEYEEISKVLDIKPTAVRVALSRARKTIREQLIKQHNYGINQN